jgi:hypothetical protein
MSAAEDILRALAAQQAVGFNSSPISQFVNDAGAEAGGKLVSGAQSVARALALPGDVFSGQTPFDPRLGFSGQDPATLDRAAELAGAIGLSSIPAPRPVGSLGMGGRIASDAVPENFPIQPGRPFTYMHNTEGAFNYIPKGSQATALDPKGRFMILDEGGLGRAPDSRWIKGETQFNNPLILNEAGWKEKLSQAYGGATGEKLTKLLKADGYDGIVTFDKYGTSEIVQLP